MPSQLDHCRKILAGVILIGRVQNVRVRHDTCPLRHSSHQRPEKRLLQTLLVGASASAGGPRARKLQRLKSSFRSSSGTTRLSTVQLIQHIQVSPLPHWHTPHIHLLLL